jgi:arylsulfatase
MDQIENLEYHPICISMRRIKQKLFILLMGSNIILFAISACEIKKSTKNEYNKKPNIILILADDLGYGDLGCYGQQKIETPNIDQLANQGVRFTRHYSGSPVCAPSRCVILTGKHTGHSYIRGNDEWNERGEVWNFIKATENPFLEGQRPIPDETVTLGEVLQNAGYVTGFIGKWGLGPTYTEGAPNKQGFDFFYGYNCQRQAHTYYPIHLWKNDKKVTLNNAMIPPGTKLPQEADPMDPDNYSMFNQKDYAPDLMFGETLQFIERNKKNSFFLEYATTIPHVSLQAPENWVDYYINKFGDEEPFPGSNLYFPCRYPRATYAAMISYMDDHVGKIVDKLKEVGILDNTLIFFTSDNGPANNSVGADSKWFNSAGPFKEDLGFMKGSLHEGGIRVPLIVNWPGKIKSPSVSSHCSSFQDFFPTICDAADILPPEDLKLDGLSFLPTILGMSNQKEHNVLYWEYPSGNGQQAVRFGKWKALRKDIFENNMEVELFDMETDSIEQFDVSDQFPDISEKAKSYMDSEHEMSVIEKFRMKSLGDSIK